MEKERNSINEINKVCKAVLKLQYNDFTEMRKIAQEQCVYMHPLKMATSRWQHDLGQHNLRVVEALENLQKILQEGADIRQP